MLFTSAVLCTSASGHPREMGRDSAFERILMYFVAKIDVIMSFLVLNWSLSHLCMK